MSVRASKKLQLLQRLNVAAATLPRPIPSFSELVITGKIEGALSTFTSRHIPVLRFFAPAARIRVDEDKAQPGRLTLNGKDVPFTSLAELTKAVFGYKLYVGPLPLKAVKKRNAEAAPPAEAAVATA